MFEGMKVRVLLTAGALLTVGVSCRSTGGKNMGKEYRVRRVSAPVEINARWDKSPWNAIESLTLDHYMGEEPRHRPRVEAKVAYDEENLYVIFRVDDRYVRAVTTELHGPVCTDSCVEFFFTPEEKTERGYFNLETNCGGTMLLYHQLGRDMDAVAVSAGDAGRIEIAHSLPTVVEPELTEPVVWVVEYRLAVSILGRYHRPVVSPGPGVRWRANFYKCADDTSHPHWLTWAPVEAPQPDFHRPEFFGTLIFE